MTDSLIIAGRSFRSASSSVRENTNPFRKPRAPSKPAGGHGDGGSTSSQPGPQQGIAARLHRSEEVLPAAQYAGCYTADEAIRAARLGREVGLSDWVKLEVIGDQATLYPDVQATLEATRVLVNEGFTVLPYTSDDIVFAKRLIDVGAAAVMPLGAPLAVAWEFRIRRTSASARNDHRRAAHRRRRVGTASDAAIAMNSAPTPSL